MRLWPLPLPSRAVAANGTGAAQGPDPIMSDLLRRNVEDLLAVREQRARGATVMFGGDLLVPVERAHRLLTDRFGLHGYTPFIRREGPLTWVQALPAATTAPASRPGLNLLLF